MIIKKNNFNITNILHNNYYNKNEYGSLHKPIYNSISYSYKNSYDLINVFQNKKKGFRYSRQDNPTIKNLENKISLMEDGILTICFSSGMSAIASIFHSLLIKNDHVIISKFLFSNTTSLWLTAQKLGIKIDIVDATNYKNILYIINKNTKIIFVETIANPMTQISDLINIGKICLKNNILYIVDNTMTSPYLFQPKSVNASLVINSLTKFISGHGNVLGGSITDTGLYNWENYSNILDNYKKFPKKFWGNIQIRSKGLRDFGGSLSPVSANEISIGSETLNLRLKRACKNTFLLSQMLKEEKNILNVYYPGLINHPQHNLAKKLFKYFGNLLSFELKKNINYLDYLNRLNIILLSSNLGDTRSLSIPVADTIYYELGKRKRKEMGINNSIIRISLGLENINNILYDFKQSIY